MRLGTRLPDKLFVKGCGKQSLQVNLVAKLHFGNETKAQRSARSALDLRIHDLEELINGTKNSPPRRCGCVSNSI